MPLNVLVTAASRRVPLVRAFRHALDTLGVRGAVIATDVNALSPAVHFCDRAYRVPLSNDPRYLEIIASLCDAEEIGLVVPTIDDELPMFGAAAAAFARRGVRVSVSSEETALICNDKYTTCTYLRGRRVPAVASYLPMDLPEQPPLPAFVKPRRGRGSVGAFPARNAKELAFFASYVEDAVVQEYLDRPEYTIDVLCDFDGRPLSIVPRERVVIRAGVIDRGRTVTSKALTDIALACTDALRFAGPVNIQCRMLNGRPTVFEINPRFSGGIPLTIAAGADFPKMLLKLALGRKVAPIIGQYQSDLWITNYESSLFVTPERMDRLIPAERAARRAVGAVA
jgi:carbamoyl-phosphate synthase large subunit